MEPVQPPINEGTKPPLDPLLACLMILCRHYHKTVSPHVLLSGLALPDHRLTIETFITAASRADLSTKISDRSLAEVAKTTLPLILILKDKRTCVLESISDSKEATIVRPEVGKDAITIPLKELASEFSGTALLISPAHKFDTRTSEPGEPAKLPWFWEVTKKAWAAYSEIFIASFLINIFSIASPLFIMNVYDRVVPNQSSETLWVLASGIFIVLIFDFIIRNLRSYFIDASGRNIDIQLSKNIFKHLLDIQMGSRPNSVGTLANTVQAFEAFRDFFTSATVSVLIDIPFVFLFLIMIGILGGWIVIVPILAIPVVLLFGILVQQPIDQLIRTSYRHSAEKNAVLIETLSSMETIKGMQAEGFMQHRWETVVDTATKIGVRLRALATLGVNFSVTAQQLAVIALVIAGVFRIQDGAITVGALVACTILISRALAPIAQIASLVTRYQQCKTSIIALDKVMQLPTERPANKSFLYPNKFEGDIEFRNVSFSYANQPVSALNNISLHIHPGEKVGIIGATGSGKSTIIKLIMKFYEPVEGSILLDKYEQHQLDPAELRRYIGYVPQDVTLFHGTIKENMVFGTTHVEDSAVIQAAKLSTVDSFVAHHPEGFNRPVGERGLYLSGGQRQAIVISRALILDPPVLIFDELSNSMDDATCTRLIEQLNASIQNKTLLIVTHKAIMLNLVNRLIVMDGGRIVADGPKDEILKQLAEHKIRAAHA